MGRGLGPYFSSASRRTAFTRRRIMADKSVARIVYTAVALCFILCAVVVMFTTDENATTLVETKAKWGGSLSKNEASPFVTPNEVGDKAQVQRILNQPGSVNDMLADSGGPNNGAKLQGNNFDGGDGELFQEDWNSYNHHGARRNHKRGRKSESMEIDPTTHKLVMKKIKNPRLNLPLPITLIIASGMNPKSKQQQKQQPGNVASALQGVLRTLRKLPLQLLSMMARLSIFILWGGNMCRER